MKGKIKGLLMAAVIVVLSLGMVACSSSLPEGLDKDTVVNKAKETVNSISNKNFDAVISSFSPEMSAAASPEEFTQTFEQIINQLGTFKSFKSEAVSSQKDDKTGNYAVVVLVCEHEKGSATYTISVNKNNQICGLFIK